MALTVTPLPQALGATVTDLDVDALDDATVEQLLQAWYENLVLFFPGLNLTQEQHIRLGSVFGRLEATSTKGDDHRDQKTIGPNGEILVLDGAEPGGRANAWHTDVTWAEHPPIGSLLSMQVCPDKGGDTLWSNQYAAYEGLSPAVQALIEGLHGTHGRGGLTGITFKPMVSTHPVTGRKALYVNRGWTTGAIGLSPIESANILNLLYEQGERPEFQVRWSWRPGDAALWDNRCTMHYAVDDYGDAERVLHRVVIYDD